MEKRLKECDSLSAKLSECRSSAEKSKANSSSSRGWFVNFSTSKKAPVSPPPSTCNKEAHALWSCRALALGCYGEVKLLQACRRETKGECKEEQVGMGRCIMEKREGMREYVKGKKRT
ncbi:hypothetical protein TrRE_jg11864 [Triparma retinervis]|uniref:Uncharacterized protein n=1 Tax=Triparma retinervis TaxID=2557542 RepID=A0A9W7E5G7_9STRA|nr:hypothetical protein TrRE_jg11864 [Triparma retinervis]